MLNNSVFMSLDRSRAHLTKRAVLTHWQMRCNHCNNCTCDAISAIQIGVDSWEYLLNGVSRNLHNRWFLPPNADDSKFPQRHMVNYRQPCHCNKCRGHESDWIQTRNSNSRPHGMSEIVQGCADDNTMTIASEEIPETFIGLSLFHVRNVFNGSAKILVPTPNLR